MIPIKLNFNTELSGSGTPHQRIAVSSSSSELLQHWEIIASSGERMEIEVRVDASPGGGGAGCRGAAVGLPHGTAPACGRVPGPTPVNNTGVTNLPRDRAGVGTSWGFCS